MLRPNLRPLYPAWIGRRPVLDALFQLPVHDKFTNEAVSRVAYAEQRHVREAIEAADGAADAMGAMPAFKRQAIIQQLAKELTARAEEFAGVLVREVGKPIRDARGEIARAVAVLELSAEEALRANQGESGSAEIGERNAGTSYLTRRFPIGPVSMITPFNFPVNLAVHKIGPAIAAGCPFIVKPSDRTPIATSMLGEMLSRTELPDGAFSVVPCSPGDAEELVTDPRMAMLSFTGSTAVGWKLKSLAGRKRVSLELGGDAACVVDEGVGGDLDRIVRRLAFGAFYQSGQSCISVQRVFIHSSLYEEVAGRLAAAARALRLGDPLDEATDVGPMISEEAAARLDAWVYDAWQKGARVRCGGKRSGALYEPTVLEDVPADCALSCEEAFGPVVVLRRFERFDEALDAVNASRFGLQTGVFTRDLARAFRAFERAEVGAVVVNDVPSIRVDSLPYGGVKDSGEGREGPRSAVREMTVERLMVLARP